MKSKTNQFYFFRQYQNLICFVFYCMSYFGQIGFCGGTMVPEVVITLYGH